MEKKDRVGLVGEPEMLTKSDVCLSTAFDTRPFGKSSFDEELLSLYVFPLHQVFFPDVFTSGLNIKKDACARFCDKH